MSSKTESITDAEWAFLQDVFDRALELPEDERTAFISHECGDNEQLKNQVEALVVAAESDKELVGSLISAAAHKVLEKSQNKLTQIGAFRIIDIIGKGGMGVVYLARRDDDEYHQQVAIKVLDQSMANEEIQRRFITERQILADLNHPNIARLLDGGHTADGQPYLVMEYIDGDPIVEYCDRHRLGIEARLDLFKQVCMAVAAAHRSLIVHRDIKPNNIMVGSDGIPKLLDFGIAKVLTNRLQDVDLAKTQMGDRLLTPDNASPEQVLGRPITTASDVYSLGVLLYQMLCGSRPFRLVDRTPAQMERIICTEVPAAPSSAIGTLAERTPAAQEVAARRRSSSVSKLRNRLQGELDNIVLMALKKEPQRRYVSASQFGSDITRHLKGQPIVAVKDTRRYRAAKFLARNRIAATAAAISVVALLVFSVATYMQSRQIAEEKAISENALEFLTDVFLSSDPVKQQKKVVSIKDLLDAGMLRASDLYANQPKLHSMIQRALGRAYDSHGYTTLALENLHASLNSRSAVYGEQHPLAAEVLQDLGGIYSWLGEWEQSEGNYLRALAIYRNRESIRYFRKDQNKREVEIANVLVGLANLKIDQGRLDDAQLHLEEALTRIEQLSYLHTFVDVEIKILDALGDVHRRKSNFQKSNDYVSRAMALFIRSHGEQDPGVAVYIDSLARIAHSMGDLDRAEELYREGLAKGEQVFGKDVNHLIRAKVNLGRFLRDRGNYEQAEILLSEVVAADRRSLGESPQDLGFDMVELAIVYMELEKFEQAKEMIADASQMYADSIGRDNPFYAESQRHYGNLLVRLGQPGDALVYFAEAINILERVPGVSPWQIAASKSEKAEAHIALQQTDEARALLASAIPVLENTLGKQHRLSLEASQRLKKISSKQLHRSQTK